MLDPDISTGDSLALLSQFDDDSRKGIDRRRFLRLVGMGLGAGVAGSIGGAPLLNRLMPGYDPSAWAAGPIGPNDGILVVIGMYGGNDSLKMGAPITDPHYTIQRGTLALTADTSLSIDAETGLHPNLTELKARWDLGQLAIVEGVGFALLAPEPGTHAAGGNVIDGLADVVTLDGLSFYNQDLEADAPADWTAFRDKIRASDAVLFVTPEYNRSMPGVLKNAIDVGSRPYGKSAFDKKPAAVVSSSPGAMGGFGANHALRQCLVFLNMPTLQQPEAYVGGIGDAFDDKGEMVKEATRGFLKAYIDAFAAFVAQQYK